MYTGKDKIFATKQADLGDFSFDEQVAEVFQDMAERSIPGYQQIIATIAQLAHFYFQPHSKIYDLGCSLGTASLAIRRELASKECSMVAVDRSAAMAARCRRHMASFKSTIPIEVIEADLLDIEIDNASVVVLNFTLQFIAPELREKVLERIFSGLLPGGILLISEKLKGPTTSVDAIWTQLYHQFKRKNGYSELEISQKRAALEKVLQPETFDEHCQRLHRIGFSSVTPWYTHFNFCSMLAIKS